MSVMIGGQSGNQSRVGTGLATSGPEYQPEVVQPVISMPRRTHPIGTRFRWSFSGVTKDSSGAALAACTLELFKTSNDVKVDSTVSDATGFYQMSAYADGPYYVVAYKAGAPDVAGTTLNTLNGE